MSKSLQRVSIPTCFGDLNCYLNVELTPGNLPLLLSVKSLKKTRAMIDVHKHMMKIPESATIDLEELASGHFAVEIFPRNSPTDSQQKYYSGSSQRDVSNETSSSVWTLSSRTSRRAAKKSRETRKLENEPRKN